MVVYKFILWAVFLFSSDSFIIPVKKIQILRKGIDIIDDKLSFLIDRRMDISKRIKNLKNQSEIEDKTREELIKIRIKENHPNLAPELIDDIWESIFDYSKKIQME